MIVGWWATCTGENWFWSWPSPIIFQEIKLSDSKSVSELLQSMQCFRLLKLENNLRMFVWKKYWDNYLSSSSSLGPREQARSCWLPGNRWHFCNKTTFIWQNICKITSNFHCKSKTYLISLNLLQRILSRSKFQTQAPHQDVFWPARSRTLDLFIKQSRSETLQSNTSTFCVQHLKSSHRHPHPYFSKSLSCAFKSSSNAIGNGFAHISKCHLYWRGLHTHFIPLGCPATMTMRMNDWIWFKKICCLDQLHPAHLHCHWPKCFSSTDSMTRLQEGANKALLWGLI